MEVGQPSAQGEWIELIYTQDGRVGKLYSNGTLVAENDEMFTMAETFSGEAPTFNWIGKAPFNGDRYLAGTMLSEFCIYDRVIVE